MHKPVIAIDIDDVLANNAAGFVTFSNHHWATNLTVEDYDEHWAEVWRVDHAEVEKRASDFYNSGVFSTYGHREEASPILEKLAKNYKLVVVTSRRQQAKPETINWLKIHYPMIDEFDVHFTCIWDVTNEDSIHRTKGDTCRRLQASYLIDDQLKHCRAAAECGIQGLLFGDYAWNKTQHLPQSVTRLSSWSDVDAYFDERTAEGSTK